VRGLHDANNYKRASGAASDADAEAVLEEIYAEIRRIR